MYMYVSLYVCIHAHILNMASKSPLPMMDLSNQIKMAAISRSQLAMSRPSFISVSKIHLEKKVQKCDF